MVFETYTILKKHSPHDVEDLIPCVIERCVLPSQGKIRSNALATLAKSKSLETNLRIIENRDLLCKMFQCIPKKSGEECNDEKEMLEIVRTAFSDGHPYAYQPRYRFVLEYLYNVSRHRSLRKRSFVDNYEDDPFLSKNPSVTLYWEHRLGGYRRSITIRQYLEKLGIGPDHLRCIRRLTILCWGVDKQHGSISHLSMLSVDILRKVHEGFCTCGPYDSNIWLRSC
jgi:hypothetical protein